MCSFESEVQVRVARRDSMSAVTSPTSPTTLQPVPVAARFERVGIGRYCRGAEVERGINRFE
jgi:hypothetical protein